MPRTEKERPRGIEEVFAGKKKRQVAASRRKKKR